MHPKTYIAGTSNDKFSIWADLCGSYGSNSIGIANGTKWEFSSHPVHAISSDYVEDLFRKEYRGVWYDEPSFGWHIKDPFADGPIEDRDDFKAPEISVESLLE